MIGDWLRVVDRPPSFTAQPYMMDFLGLPSILGQEVSRLGRSVANCGRMIDRRDRGAIKRAVNSLAKARRRAGQHVSQATIRRHKDRLWKRWRPNFKIIIV